MPISFHHDVEFSGILLTGPLRYPGIRGKAIAETGFDLGLFLMAMLSLTSTALLNRVALDQVAHKI